MVKNKGRRKEGRIPDSYSRISPTRMDWHLIRAEKAA